MSKGLFFTTRSVTGREGKGIVAHMGIMQLQSDELHYLSSKISDQTKDFIESYSDIRIRKNLNLYGKFYEEAMHMADWMEVYEKLDVTPLQSYDNLYIIGGIDLWRSELTRGSKRNFVFPRDRGQMKFQSCGSLLINMLAMLKAHREFGIPLHEMAFDPNEMSLDLVHPDVAPLDNYHLYHGYDIYKYKTNRLDSLQYFFKDKSTLFDDPTDKPFDFTFGFTVLEMSGRTDYSAYVKEHASRFPKSNVFCKNYLTGENTLVDRDVYLDYISKSRFTMLLPAYDANCFSIYRFIESIHNNCLPMLHKNCNVLDVEQSFGIDLSPLMVYDIPDESKRLELLDYYKNNVLSVKRGFQ